MMGSKPKTHCRKGHEFTPANSIMRSDRPGHKLCRECDEARRHAWERARRKPHPSETGWCRSGLHAWTADNLLIRADGNTRCRACNRIKRRDGYHRYGVFCIARGCKRHTMRRNGEPYICPQHRANPPEWIARAGLRIVGAGVLVASGRTEVALNAKGPPPTH